MTEADHLLATRESYDTVAETYDEFVKPRFAADAVGRGLLAAFAELAREVGPIADLGCGPGHVTAHLAGLGAPVSGVDLSPNMVAIARRTYPRLRFEVGSLTDLGHLPDGGLGGVLAWSSTMHVPPAELPGAFAGFHRVLAPGGHLLLSFHAGDGHLKPERGYGHPVTYEAWLRRPDDVVALLEDLGLEVTARVLQPGPKWTYSTLLARKPA
ncbi:class I SAM-dependent DNA methyltransferase [Actinosynnema sp. NPDC059797]